MCPPMRGAPWWRIRMSPRVYGVCENVWQSHATMYLSVMAEQGQFRPIDWCEHVTSPERERGLVVQGWKGGWRERGWEGAQVAPETSRIVGPIGDHFLSN